MAIDGKLMAQARDRLTAIKENNRRLQEERLLEVYTRVPYVRELDAQLRELMGDVVGVSLKKGEAAKLLHYDFYWLSHEIKNQTGKTYTELLQDKRLSQAAYLLKNTKIGVDDISKAVGYENKSYFHRIFAKQFEMSPKKYRDN